MSSQSTIIPALKYQDAPAAIEWLCHTFGFSKNLVVPGEGNTIAHAQLTLGGGMIMVGSAGGEDEWSQHIKQPNEIGGCETQSAFIVVDDADAVFARVRDAGGEVLIDIHDEDYGGRGFACRDIGGHIWYVGTYNPWAPPTHG